MRENANPGIWQKCGLIGMLPDQEAVAERADATLPEGTLRRARVKRRDVCQPNSHPGNGRRGCPDSVAPCSTRCPDGFIPKKPRESGVQRSKLSKDAR